MAEAVGGPAGGRQPQAIPTVPPLPAPRRLAVLAAVGAAAVLVTLPAGLRGEPGRLDEAAFRRLNDPAGLLGAVLRLGEPLIGPVAMLGWCLAVIVAVRSSGRGGLVAGSLAAVLAGGTAAVVVNLAKPLVGRERPLASLDDVLTHGYPAVPRGLSYPSSHTAVVTAVVVVLWPWLSRAWRAGAVAVAVLIALSRPYVGAHFPTDVVGGAGVGLLVGAAGLAAVRRLAAGRPLAGP